MKLYFDQTLHTFHDGFERYLTQHDDVSDIPGIGQSDLQLNQESTDSEPSMVTQWKFNDLVADKARLKGVLNRLFEDYWKLKAGETVQQVCNQPERDVHLVTGFMHSGSSFLMDRLLATLGIDGQGFERLMFRDGIPSYGSCIPEFAKETSNNLLLELAEYAYWLKDCWPSDQPVLQERSAYAHNLSYIEKLMGKNVHWWVALRNPSDVVAQFFQSSDVNPLENSNHPAFWQIAAQRYHQADFDVWNKQNNYKKSLEYWSAYHQDLFSQMDKIRNVYVCCYENVESLSEQTLPIKPNLENFVTTPVERPSYFDGQAHNQAIDRVLDASPEQFHPLLTQYRV